MKRTVVWLIAGVCSVLWGLGVAGAQTKGKTHHVVFSLASDDQADWSMVAHNIVNLISGFKPDTVEVELVTYHGGLGMVKKGSPVAEDVAQLLKQHVRIVACENSMRAQGLEKKDLLEGVETVSSAVVELTRKQEEGWAYIKGGGK